MVQQVFMNELTDSGGGLFRRTNGVLAFGWHPAVPNMRTELGETQDKTHPVTSATAEDQRLRVVFDELLIGNYLEEVLCRDRSWSRVPEGTTPDDIARCAVSDDLLSTSCTGPHAVCLVNGVPVGVKDKDDNNVSDGAADDTRLICADPDPNAATAERCLGGTPVRLICGTIEVKLNFQLSFWQPAGNQLVPARQTPENSIGPALILVPFGGLLPPSTTCRLEFNGDVTDKEYNQVCVPTGGTEDTDDIGDCEAGDVSAFSFGVESIRFDSSSPSRGAVGVLTSRRTFFIDVTAPIDPASATAANTVFTEDPTGAPPPVVRTDLQVSALGKRINFVLPAGAPDLLPDTTYTISIDNLRDSFGGPIAGPLVLTFTTAP